MRRIFRLFAIIVVLILIAILWFWWNRPIPVDMAANVPADSLVYLEANSLTDITSAISETDTWQSVAIDLGFTPAKRRNDWLTYLAKTTGLGSATAVIAARAQIAFVILDLSSQGNGDALEFKSQVAVIVETHTSAYRVRPAMESAISTLAARIYVHPRVERVTIDGNDFTRWIAPDNQRRIVAAVDGSLVVVGNDERAVSACLAARHGERPSLLHKADLEEMRTRLKAAEALAFGYASGANTARIISVIAPMKVGVFFAQPQFQKLLTMGAANLLGNVAWSAHRFNGGIEDSYLIDLKPEDAARLQPAFVRADQRLQGAWEFVPAEADSVSSYNILEPSNAWLTCKTVISSRLDILSAVLFTDLSRNAFQPYGIDEPDVFLQGIKPEILTVRIASQSEHPLVVAHIGKADILHQFITRRFGTKPRSEKVGDVEVVLSPDEEFAASFADDYFLLGAPADVRRSLASRAAHESLTSSSSAVAALTHYLERPSAAHVVTYARDGERTRAFINTVAIIRGTRSSISSGQIDRVISGLPFATTETKLGENGFERRTRSAFGQFAFLVSYLNPEPDNTSP